MFTAAAAPTDTPDADASPCASLAGPETATLPPGPTAACAWPWATFSANAPATPTLLAPAPEWAVAAVWPPRIALVVTDPAVTEPSTAASAPGVATLIATVAPT